MAQETILPVQVLRSHVTALEAALSVCLADPGHKPVHKLRTETRRVEALLLLLAQTPGLPEHEEKAGTLRKELKRLRRAAGHVRDMDVQRKLLEGFAPEPADGALEAPKAEEQDTLASGAHALRTRLAKGREASTETLQKLLKKRQARQAGAAEALLDALNGAEEQTLAVGDLLRCAQAVLVRDDLLGKTDPGKLKNDDLHTVRKSAKAARYLAETLPDSAEAAAAAAHYESLQEAGGHWHDLLDLTQAARRWLGKHHELTEALGTERDRYLAAYRKALAAEAQGLTAAEGKSRGRGKGRSRRASRPGEREAEASGKRRPGAAKAVRKPATKAGARRRPAATATAKS